MSKFKAGDLALIIGGKYPDTPNTGKSVELIQLVQPDEVIDCPDGHRVRNGSGKVVWLIEGNEIMSRSITHNRWVSHGGVALIQERYLMPLKGDFQPEQEKSKELVQ